MYPNMYQDLTFWHDTPSVQVGNWRMLIPNNYGRKYRGINYAIVVHQCQEDPLRRDNTMSVNAMRDDPKCDACGEVVPEDVQGLYKLFEFNRMAE